MSTIWIAVGAGLVALLVVGLFGSRKARLIAAGTLTPLLLLGWVIYAAGQQDRPEADDLQSEPTLFGDGQLLGERLEPLLALKGLTWPDRGHRYTPSTLWDRMDGGAEVYRELGMRAALFATAQVAGGDVEVQLFDMGAPEKAGAIYAKATNGQKHPAVLWEGGGEMRDGRLYARIVLSTASKAPEVLAAPKRLLEALGASFQAEAPAGAGLPETVSGVGKAERRAGGWAGRAWLGEALVGEAEDESEVFVAAPGDPKAALEKLKGSLDSPTEAEGIWSASDAYVGDVLFARKGPRIAGVAGFEDRAAARALLRRILADLPGPN